LEDVQGRERKRERKRESSQQQWKRDSFAKMPFLTAVAVTEERQIYM
jgi:hypothetical protein